jgi:hypothetical protein
MIRGLFVVLAGVISISSIILFSEISGKANDNTSDNRKAGAAEIVKFSIRPVTLRMFPGGSMQLVATAYDSRGEKITITPEWKLKSEISELGEFDKTEGDKVVFSALNSGSGSIVAVYNDLEAEVRVEIFGKKRKK